MYYVEFCHPMPSLTITPIKTMKVPIKINFSGVAVIINQHKLDIIIPLSANPTKWSKTLKQFLGKLPTNCLSVFVHFVKLALCICRKKTLAFLTS